MDGELYVLERIARDRLAAARARAEVARMLHESHEFSRSDGLERRSIETGRSLLKMARKVAAAISHVLGDRTRLAKHP